MRISSVSLNNNNSTFKARSYGERLKDRLDDMGWFERNFGGGTSDAKEAVEEEMRDEIDDNWRRVSYAKDAIERARSDYNSEISRIEERMQEIESEIKTHRVMHPFQRIRIRALQAKAYMLGIRTSISEGITDRVSRTTNKKREASSNLTAQTHSLENDIKTLKLENDTKVKAKVTEFKEKAQEEHEKQIDKLINSPMLYLKQNVILPLKMLQASKEFSMPNGILIDTSSNVFSRLILRWITKNTDSNYARINANEFNTEEEFFEKLVSVSEQTRNEYIQNGKHTFTLISNIENFLNKKRKQLIPYLKTFMDTTASDNFNTIILSVKHSDELDPILIAKHRFPVKMNLSTQFLCMKKYGFFSMLFDSFKMSTQRKNLNPKKLFH